MASCSTAVRCVCGEIGWWHLTGDSHRVGKAISCPLFIHDEEVKDEEEPQVQDWAYLYDALDLEYSNAR